jgi:hypothetical protein
MSRNAVYNTPRGPTQVQFSSQYNCPKCVYSISGRRCFNCDYAARGRDGPWNGTTDQGEIQKAELIWNTGLPLTSLKMS